MAFTPIRQFFHHQKEYYQFEKQEISNKNLHMLKKGSFLYAGVLLFYTLITLLSKTSPLLTKMYFIFDGVHVLLCIFVFLYFSRGKDSPAKTSVYCFLFELSILGFFVIEAVFVTKSEHSLYIPIAIILVLLLFIHSFLYANLLTIAYLSSYVLLSFLNKTPEVFQNDFSVAIATLIAANIGYILIAQLRYSEARAMRQYEMLSRQDQLTGLYNKTTIEALCAEKLSQPEFEGVFVIMDLDNFKSVNDVYGHDMGDEVLRAVGDALKTTFQKTDLIGRYGGDEFIALFETPDHDQESAMKCAVDIIKTISELQFSNHALHIQCCAGISVNRPGDTLQTILKRADAALYEAKASGKNCCRTATID